MNKLTRPAVVALATLWCAATPASIQNVENAYETDTSRAALPSNPRGLVVIRDCATCKPVTLRVDRETRYFIKGATGPVTLSALRAAVAEDAGDERLLTVFYSLETGTVTRIVLAGN